MKKYLVIAIVLLALLGGGLYTWRAGLVGDKGNNNAYLYSLVKDNPEFVDLYNKALAAEASMAKNPNDAGFYMDAGLDWKSIAERIGTKLQKPFFERSLKVYEQGIAKFGQGNILFYLNGGNLAEHLSDFAKAEDYYKQAIKISPGDDNSYIKLLELYQYRMSKSEAEILAMLDQGTKNVLNPIAIISGRATYLRRIGNFKAALPDYQLLSRNYPSNIGYKEIIAELQAKIAAASTTP